jgi:hypothetical protein
MLWQKKEGIPPQLYLISAFSFKKVFPSGNFALET